MTRKPITGHCRLCGEFRALTKEHIPAKGAYKGQPYRMRVQEGEEYLAGRKGRIYQRGYYSMVLCEDCNPLTGTWYGNEFAEWSRWGFRLLQTLNGPSSAQVPVYEGRPLRIAKQVITTMIAASSADLTERRPDLRAFVLDRYCRGESGQVRLTTYLCPTSSGRSTGVAVAMQPGRSPHVLVEFALPPFGYVLTLDGEPFDPRPADISWFTTCGYDETKPVVLPVLPILETHEAWPGDYRTKEQIRRDVIENILTGQGHPTPRLEAAEIMATGRGPDFFKRSGEEW